MNKKADVSYQTVILMVVIASFIVLLYFVVKLNLKGETDLELCHNSVAMRSNALISTNFVPLNCKTSYVCITSDGSCEAMTNPEIKKVKAEEEVYRALADEMANCWWMFGERKLDYVGKKAEHNNYCSICSQVVFDDSAKQIAGFETGNISKDEFYDYLSETKMSNKGISYSEYFFGTDNINELKKLANDQYGAGGTFGKIDLNKQYYIMMGITSEISAFKWIAGGTMITEGAYIAGAFVLGLLGVSTPIGWVATAIVVGSGAGSGWVGSEISSLFNPEISAIVVEGNGVNNEFMAPTIIEADPAKFEALNCESIETLS